MLRFAILLTLLVASKAEWVIKTNHDVIEIGVTQNVTLECQFSGSDTDIVDFFRIRVVRLDDLDIAEPIGYIDFDSSIKTKISGITAHGSFNSGNLAKPFFAIVWPIATNKTVGKFKCEINGYSAEDNAMQKDTRPIVITEKTLTLEELIKETQSKFQTKLDALQKQSLETDASLRREISECNRKRQEEIEKLTEEILEMKNANANELTKHNETNRLLRQEISDLKNDWQQVNNETKKEITNVKSLISNQIKNQTANQIQDAYFKVQGEISDLRKESNETDAKLEKEISDATKQCQAAEDKLRVEISDSKNFTTQEIANQTEEVKRQLRREISKLGKESQGEYTKLKETILETKNQIKDKEENFTNILSHLRNESSNEITKRTQESEARLQQQVSELRKENNETLAKLLEKQRLEAENNLQKEILEITNKSTVGAAKLRQRIFDLKTFTVNELSKLDQVNEERLEEELSKVKELVINGTGKQNQENLSKLQEEISGLRNESNETDAKLKKEIFDAEERCQAAKEKIRTEISDFKNFTARTMLNQTENIEQKLQGEISELIEKGKGAMLETERLISGLRNETSDEIWKRAEETEAKFKQEVSYLKKENNETLAKIRQEIKMKTYTDEQLKKQLQDVEMEIELEISKLSNQTFENKVKLERAILNVKDILKNEISAVDERARKEHTKIQDMILNRTHESCESNLTDIITDLINRTDALEINRDETVDQIDSNLKRLDDWINAIDKKYENVTDNLWANLSKKSECSCPTSVPPVTTEVTTTTALTSSPGTTEMPTTNAPFDMTEWPKGNFGIVATNTSCPMTESYTWEEGWIQFHTASDFNEDMVSPGNHFKKPIFRSIGHDNFVHLHYCLKKNSANNAPEWPAGSYCLNRVNGHCPTGFRSGYIQYDGEHTHVQHIHQNPPDIHSPSGSVDRVYYCCRKDGDPKTKITLPNTTPFFLYRAAKTSECQRVTGMTVSVEIVQIDTSHEDNRDEFDDPDIHPDAKLHPVEHTLCYYSPIGGMLRAQR